jgi:PAS domain S-box-containing protein
MTAKMDQFPAVNSNPMLIVAKDGVVLYSNKAGEPLLHDWGVRVGEKVPSYLEIFVQRAISRKNIEKIEVTLGKKVYFIVFHLSPEQECVNVYGFDISGRKKLEGKSQKSEAQEKAKLELARIINAKAIQSLMNDFYTLAHIPMGLTDLKGNVLVSVGWQDICTRFHRISPEACKHCIESDINLTAGVAPGGYKLYKCKNNMWDVVTPVMVEGQHVGNIFSGHFFFEGEPLNYELFRSQARKYGFNEEEYLKALDKVPRLSKEAVNTSMTFFMTFANMISQLSYSNIKLSQSLAEHDAVLDALQESEKRELARSEELAVLLDAVPVAVYIAHDPQAFEITGNRLSYEWLRIPVGTNFSKSAPEGEKPETFKLLKNGVELQPKDMPSQLSATGIEINDCELDIVSAEGRIRHVLGNARPLRDEQGNLRGSISAFIDITERKKVEEALRLSNIYNRSLIEASLDPLVTIGRDGKITDVNGATEQVTGYSRNDLIGTDFSDYFTEPEKAREGYQQVFMDSEVRDYPLEIRHKDGHITPVLYNASVYRDENGKVIGVFAAARDITAIKKAEEIIQTLANVVESSDDAILTKSLDGVIISWNKGAEKLYGYLAEEVLGKNVSMLEPGNTRGETKNLIEKIKHGERVRHYETLRMKKDGTIIDISVTLSPVFDTSGKLVAISTITRDITENKKAEEAIRLSNLYNRSLIEASLDPLVTIGRDGKITDVNNATEQVTGYSRNDLIGTDFSDYFTEPEEARAGYQQVFKDSEVRDYPLEIRHKDGHTTPVLYNASVYRDENGEVTGVFAAARDITERKLAEEALKKAHENLEKIVEERTAELEKAYVSLKESEKGLAEAQEMAHIGNWEWDTETDKAYWSEEMYRIFKRAPQELAPSYDEFLSYIHPDDRDYVDNALKKKAAVGEKIHSVEYRIVLANEEERTVHMQSETTFDEKDTRVKGIIQDITERKRSEEKLQILANAVESSNDAIVTLSLNGVITSWNKAAEQIYGYSAEEILGEDISILEPENIKGEIKQFSEKIKQGKKVQHYESTRLKKGGTIINISVTLSPIFDVTGKLVAISGIVRDVTERIKAEEALRESEARLRQFYESDMLGVYYFDLEGSVTDANDKLLEIVGYTREDLQAGKVSWNKMTPQEYRSLDERTLAELKTIGIKEPLEKEYIRKDGSRVPVIVGIATFDQARNEGIAFVLDITEKKKAEEALANIETTRKKEIHHRIKNNLQVISSLLDLQADKFDNPRVIEAFRESQNRVISMALIHEELYKGEGTDTLDFSTYIRELAENLFQTYSLKSKNIHLLMDLEENVFLNMDTGVPLGIIVNELVSNSLKHAFPGKDKGEIQIKLHREKNGKHKKKDDKATSFILIVSDNGVGIPENLNIKDVDSLGIQLITTLADQLDGKFELKNNNGTEFIMRFTLIDKR